MAAWGRKVCSQSLCMGMTRPYSETLAAADAGIPRHYCRCKDCAFIEPLPLPGWEERSIWGFDNSERSFLARLWRNGSRARRPFASLPADWHVYWWPPCLALDIIAVTRMDAIAVLSALVLLDPASTLRRAAEIEPALDTPPGVTAEFQDGFRRALLWVLGRANICPGSRSEWCGGQPSAQLVDAEFQLLVGRVYSQKMNEIFSQQFNSGGEAALSFVLGRYDAARGC